MRHHLISVYDTRDNFCQLIVADMSLNIAERYAGYYINDEGYAYFNIESFEDLGDLQSKRRAIEEWSGVKSIWW